jgi:hypothetical protein
MATRVVVNDGTIAQLLATDPAMQRALESVATNLVSQAVANSPVGRSRSRLPRRGQGRRRGTGGPEATSSGYYRRHFELNRYRGGWRVRNTDPFAHLVEWGSINNSAYAPIRRAIRTSGLRYVPNPESRGA